MSNRQTSGQLGSLDPLPEPAPHEPVFETVEGEHGQATAGLQGVEPGVEPAVEFAKFVVDVNAHGLEDAGTSRCGRSAARYGSRDHFGKVRCGLERSSRDNGPCDPASMAFLAVATDHGGEILRLRLVQPIPGGHRIASVHPHVERSGHRKPESPTGFVELRRGHAHIEHDAGLRARSALVVPGEIVAERTESAVPGLHAGIRPSQMAGAVVGIRITVDGEEPPTRRQFRKQSARVTTAPEGRVHVESVAVYGKRFHHFLKHHRHMRRFALSVHAFRSRTGISILYKPPLSALASSK